LANSVSFYTEFVKKQKNSEQSMRERAYRYIQQKIASREFTGGTPIPELSICKALGISRTPTREALRQLITEGLLQEVRGRGAIVAKLTREDLIEMYELREALESFSVQKLARMSIPAADIKIVQGVADEILALKKALDRSGRARLGPEEMNQFEASDIAFHTLLAHTANSSRSLKLLNEIRLLIRIFTTRHVGHDSANLKRIYEGHCEIIRGISRQNPEHALLAIVKHIQESRQDRLEEYDRWERESSLKGSFGLILSNHL
jgi:DNA-binding GntR family transcriptional regulator